MNKKVIIVFMCLIFFITGCGKAKETAADTNVFLFDNIQLGYDGQPFFENTFSSFAKTENGYYYYDDSYRSSLLAEGITYLMYFDSETRKSVPVCSKADCLHTLETECDAIFGTANLKNNIGWVQYLWYYDGSLYTVANNLEDYSNVYYIYQISLDGSKRTKYLKLFESSGELMYNMYYHRGYIYAAIELENNTTALYRVKMEKDAELELIYEFTGIGSMFTGFDLYNTGITFMNSYFTDDTYENSVGTINYYNPVNGEVKTLADEMFFESYKIVNDNIYYSKNGEIYVRSIKTGEEKKFFTCEYPVYISYDGKYLYAEACSGMVENYDEHFVYVLDLEKNLVDSIQVASSQDCYFGDENYLFQMFDLNDDLSNKADMAVIKAFDKSQIGTGKYEWIELPLPELN